MKNYTFIYRISGVAETEEDARRMLDESLSDGDIIKDDEIFNADNWILERTEEIAP